MPNESADYLKSVVDLLGRIESEQLSQIKKAGALMADAIGDDRLIHVYGGGGHTTLVMGEMFFRAGGLANTSPIMETWLSVFNQAIKYLNLERCVNYGRSIMKYYNLQKGDLLVIFHNIGINAATIDAALEAKERSATIIAVSSSLWQKEEAAGNESEVHAEKAGGGEYRLGPGFPRWLPPGNIGMPSSCSLHKQCIMLRTRYLRNP